jgi:hypothetical protein
MPAPQSERMLRRAVAKLQTLPPAYCDAVLDTLDQIQRSRVLTLLDGLQERSAPDVSAAVPSPFDDVILPPNLSPWLVARINGSGDDGNETADQFIMTVHARKALRRCAADLVPQPVRHSPTPSLASRLIGLFV